MDALITCPDCDGDARGCRRCFEQGAIFESDATPAEIQADRDYADALHSQPLYGPMGDDSPEVTR